MWAATRASARLSRCSALRSPLTSNAAVAVAAPAATALPQSATALPQSEKRTQPSLPGLYWKLSKGKLTVWVALSALPGYFLALPALVDPLVVGSLLGGTFLTSASAQALNQVVEVERDAVMKRTAARPLPAGHLSITDANIFAALAGSSGLCLLSIGATPATAGIAAITMGTYVAMYTPLKVITPYNTHVGAVSGSLPTLMGFTAALGAGLASSPWAPHAAFIFGMQTLWQMPHFYALAWLYRSDYARGGYNMFPLTDETGSLTASLSKPYLVALCALPWGMSAAGLASWMLPVGALVPSALWWRAFAAFEEKPSQATCRRFFLGSLSYLLSMLALVTFFSHAPVPQEKSEDGEERTTEQKFLEPAWRARMQESLMAACPHEQVRYWLFGAAKPSCPLSK